MTSPGATQASRNGAHALPASTDATKHFTDSRAEAVLTDQGAHDAAESRGLQRESALTGLLGLAQEDVDDTSPSRTGGASAASSATAVHSASGVSGGNSTGSNQVAKLIDRSGLSPSRKDRLERNRTAAQQCRKRKKEYVKRIEEEVAKLRASNLLLRSAVATATAENELLRRENEMYRRIVQSRGAAIPRDAAPAAPGVETSILAAALGKGAAAQPQAGQPSGENGQAVSTLKFEEYT